MQVKDMTKIELKILIRETVEEVLQDYLDDIEQNLTIKDEVKKRLIESKKRTDSGETGIPLSQVINQLKLNS
jgi:predicted RNA-binding protein with RPS1 domain